MPDARPTPLLHSHDTADPRQARHGRVSLISTTIGPPAAPRAEQGAGATDWALDHGDPGVHRERHVSSINSEGGSFPSREIQPLGGVNPETATPSCGRKTGPRIAAMARSGPMPSLSDGGEAHQESQEQYTVDGADCPRQAARNGTASDPESRGNRGNQVVEKDTERQGKA